MWRITRQDLEQVAAGARLAPRHGRLAVLPRAPAARAMRPCGIPAVPLTPAQIEARLENEREEIRNAIAGN